MNGHLSSHVLETARHRSGYSVIDLWVAYFSIGGRASVADVLAILAGRAQPDRPDHDRLAQALNDRFIDMGLDDPVPYFDDVVR